MNNLLSEPRQLDRALADLILHRNEETIRTGRRALLDRMIRDLEAEIAVRIARRWLPD